MAIEFLICEIVDAIGQKTIRGVLCLGVLNTRSSFSDAITLCFEH